MPIGRAGSVTALLAAMTCTLLVGCSDEEEAPDGDAEGDVIPENVPVPPADAPKLFVTRHRTPVRARPAVDADVLGELALGGRVPRSTEPITRRGCPDGWYAVRPAGFVCAGSDATVDGDHPAATVFPGPGTDRPMPYRYGRVSRGAGVSYGAAPSPEQQAAAEPKLGKLEADVDGHLGLAANDVPLSEDHMPSGVGVLGPDGDGVGADGFRTLDSWWSVGDDAMDAGTTLLAGDAAAQTRVLKRRSGVAIARTFMVGDRRFGLMPNGRLLPTDRLVPAMGSTWHGADISEIGLPVGFALRSAVPTFHLDKGKAERLDEDYEQREMISLTGKFRTVGGIRYYYTRQDHWVRHKDMILAFNRSKFPDWATEDQKWLDVSLANQYAIVWMGKKPLYATLISSGADRLGDPKTDPATAQGVFKIRSKHVTRAIDDREVGQAYSVDEAPWVMEFAEGFSITGCYWHERFGEARSFHDIAVSPLDAHWLWHWLGPEVPEGWHSLRVAEDAPDNAIIYVHK